MFSLDCFNFSFIELPTFALIVVGFEEFSDVISVYKTLVITLSLLK